MSHPLHVAFVLDSFRIGGTEINAVRTAEQLCAEGLKITVFHLSAGGPLRKRYEALGIEIHHIPIKNFYAPSTFRQGMRLAARVREANIDVVHTHDIYTNIFALPYLRVATGCSILASRRWGRSVFPNGLNRVNRYAFRFAHRILGNSSAVSELLRVNDNVPIEKIVTLPNFVDDEAFTSADEPKKLLSEIDLPDDVTVVGIVARLEPVKNHACLLEAIAQLPESVHLVVVGDGSERSNLEQLAITLGIGSRVHFPGEVPAGSQVQRQFDLCALTSHDEGFPNSVVEAMAAGKAVVATAVGGVVDAVRDGETGLLVEPGSSTELAEAIRRLCENVQLRDEMGMAGLSVARKNFSRAAVISNLKSIYRDLHQQRRGHR